MDLDILESYVDDGIVIKEENDGLVVYNCGDENLVKISVNSDKTYECDFSGLHKDLEFIVDSIKFENEFDGLGIPYFVDDNTGLKYFNNKDIMKVIRKDVMDLFKKSMNNDSFIRAYLYQELINLGYNDDFRLIDFDAKDDRYRNGEVLDNTILNVAEEIFARDLKYSKGYYFDGETMAYHFEREEDKVSQFDELVEIIQNVFGVNSQESNELLSHFIWFDSANENNFKLLFLNGEYPDVVRDMFEYAMKQYERKYIKYIADNVKIDFTLKEAYNVLSEEIKKKLAEDIFCGDSLETKFMSDIINVLSMKCLTKDKKNYDREVIKSFLINKSSSIVPMLMPDDFDVFKDLGKMENEEIVEKYEQMAINEEENGRSR